MHPREHARRNPDKPAAILATSGKTLTYGELDARANQGAQYLRRLGIGVGDTVAVWLPNVLAWYEVFWAAQRAGVYFTPISTRLTAKEAAYIVADCGARLLVTNPAIAGAADLLALRSELPALAQVVTAGPLGIAEPLGLERWEDVIADCPATPIADEAAGFHMVYSSGTTGRPKGVRVPLPGGEVVAPTLHTLRLRDSYGGSANSIYLSPAPLYHAAPLVYTTATQRLGGTVVVMEKFTPEATLAAIERYRITLTQMVPTMFLRLLRVPKEQRLATDTSSLTHVIHAAAPCPIPVKQGMIDWLGPIIYEYYGSSEGCGSTYITSEEWLRKQGSVGRADWGTPHICDDDGNELPPGQAGQIYFEGGWEFAYHNDPEKTAQSCHPRHPTWRTLGDVGYLDEDGYLFLTDRKSYMIISGGVNIYPQEIENLLAVHPAVGDVAVFGVPSAEMGEEVKAVVEPRDPAAAGPELEAELIAYCRAHLSPVKCPRSIDFEAALPRTETGKLFKRELRDRYWQGHTTRIA